VGKCSASDTITVNVAPYPIADAGLDTAICFGKTTVLHGSIVGSSFAWSPTGSLINYTTLNPIAGPETTTTYTLYAYDTIGCPKPGLDTVLVTVVPPVQAFAGNDTNIVAGQPLQLNATGGSIYTWSPTTGMNDSTIANPLVTLPNSIDTITYHVHVSTPGGCAGDASVTVYIFQTLPEIFVPTAFTPNGDGRNDILKPTVAGMKQFLFFRVFNRYGQMLYSTSELGRGWDGTYGGIPQPSGTYVFEAEATDYLGHTVLRKGTAVLIR
jgi:gliding motility-associated-like protein